MQKNLVLFVVLAVLTFLGWSMLMKKYYPLPLAKPVSKVAAGPVGTGISSSTPVAASGALAAPALKAKPAAHEERVTIKTAKLEASFSTVGASIVSWKLLPFKEHKDSLEPVQLVPLSSEAGTFCALELSGLDLENTNWTLESKAPRLNADGSQELSFSTRLAAAPVLIRKTFVIEKDDFIAHIKLDFVNQGKSDLKLSKSYLVWGPGLGQPDSSQQGGAAMASVIHVDKKIERERPSNEEKVFEYAAPKWAALKNHYFVAAFIPEGDAFVEAQTRRHRNGRNGSLSTALGLGEILLKAGQTQSVSARLYAGPQIYEKLESFGVNLQRVVQFQFYSIFEWLNPLCIGMLHVLRWFYAVTGNWGLAIILLTALVRGALFYPSQKSMVSMRRMQTKMAAMQPRLDSIKKAHKDDPQKLNAEMMRLYKEYGVNPLGGCVPMLLQIPVFFSLYGTLMAAFEIRGAHFFWKWDDLSGPDPTNLFGLFMGASMFLQQRMAPPAASTASDEQAQMQKMMMYMMPIMFTGMAIWFKWPMGLLLYWSVSNLFGILQQWHVNRTVK